MKNSLFYCLKEKKGKEGVIVACKLVGCLPETSTRSREIILRTDTHTYGTSAHIQGASVRPTSCSFFFLHLLETLMSFCIVLWRQFKTLMNGEL